MFTPYKRRYNSRLASASGGTGFGVGFNVGSLVQQSLKEIGTAAPRLLGTENMDRQ